MLQTLSRHLALEMSARAAPALTFPLALTETGVQRGEDPAQHRQHQEHCHGNSQNYIINNNIKLLNVWLQVHTSQFSFFVFMEELF